MRKEVATIECDTCPAIVEATSLRQATIEARAVGWKVTSKRDQCGMCLMPDDIDDAPRSLVTRLMTIGSYGCWCGSSGQHDWPGKTQGVPHPR